MQITEVRVKLMEDPHERLMAFCSITLDGCFVIRDLKLIQGRSGPFVAMPSRKLTDRCSRCHMKNHLRAAYCNQCGARLRDDRAVKDDDGRAKLYADVAHPINCECREQIQTRVVEAYEHELVLSKQPGYVCTYDDYGEERFAELDEFEFASETFATSGRMHRVDPPEQVGGSHDGAARGLETRPVGRTSADEDFGAGLI
jgi:stage V sporulation protein G